MELLYVFDAERFRLGSLCIRGHVWPGTQQSLRRIHPKAPNCVACTGRKQSDWLISFLDYKAMGWPSDQKLGKLCPQRHQWNNLDVSLRKNGSCIECEKQRDRSRLETRRNWYNLNRESLNARARARWSRRYQTNQDLRLYHRQKTQRRKAILRAQTALHVSSKQLCARFSQFGNRCAYCGASGDMQIEHVIPISKGGTHAIGNIVPACQNCNLSKRDKEAEQWYRAQPQFDEKRWRKICKVLAWDRSAIGQLALL